MAGNGQTPASDKSKEEVGTSLIFKYYADQQTQTAQQKSIAAPPPAPLAQPPAFRTSYSACTRLHAVPGMQRLQRSQAVKLQIETRGIEDGSCGGRAGEGQKRSGCLEGVGGAEGQRSGVAEEKIGGERGEVWRRYWGKGEIKGKDCQVFLEVTELKRLVIGLWLQ